MLFRRLAVSSFALCLGLTFPSAGFAAESVNLLKNGDFQADADGDGKPDAWPTPDGVTWADEEGNRFLRIEARPDKMLTVYNVVQLSSGHEAFSFSVRARANELKPGKANWHDGRIILDFKDADGNKLKGGPGHPAFKGTTNGWVEKTVEFLVPEGATQLEVMPAMFQAASGSLDLDDLKLTPADPAPIRERQAAAAATKAADQASRAAKVKPQVPVTPPGQYPPMLLVKGNQIETVDGKSVWLQGVSIPSMEWAAGGENILKSTEEALTNWNANVIRLCVKDNFWSGTGPYQNDGGAAYRQLVEDVINLAAAKQAYVVIDLHRYRAPEESHAAFWREVATKYKNHPAVLFELINEPHDISWDVWKNGGFVSTEKKQTDALTENQEKLKGFESIGMQALLDVVRETGAKNIAVVGGLDWSYDLSGILEGYALEDHGGNGIVYSTHVYPWKSDWEGKFMKVAEKHPIFIGECGAPPERLEFIPPERHEDPSTWVPDFLGLVQKHKYHWTAWSFHPKASPVLLSNWDYEPTPYWGVPAKEALHGKQFELKRLR